MKIAIVGCGVAGTLACLECIYLGMDPTDIVLIDPYFDGGSLGRKWGCIQSNTTWGQIEESLHKYPSAQSSLEYYKTKYTDDQTCCLTDLSLLLVESLRPFFPKCEIYCEECLSLHKTENGWMLKLESKELSVDIVFLCQGGKQKRMDYGKPILSLEIAFDKKKLEKYLTSKDEVILFGLAHSGTLILKNLLEIGCRINAVYKGKEPFLFARDNQYDGIKQESAEIADMLRMTKPQTITYIRSTSIQGLVKAIQRSNWIFNATGFEAETIPIYSTDNQLISAFQYSPESAEICQNLYGFGLAYPGVTTVEGVTYKDVSIPSFVQQICRTLPAILSKNSDS